MAVPGADSSSIGNISGEILVTGAKRAVQASVAVAGRLVGGAFGILMGFPSNMHIGDEVAPGDLTPEQKAANIRGSDGGMVSGSPGGFDPDDPNDDKNNKTDHGNKRANEAKSDPNRSVGDSNKIVRDGTRYKDTRTGNDVYVKGNRVVVVKEGKIHSQFKNSKANTNGRVNSGRWKKQ